VTSHVSSPSIDELASSRVVWAGRTDANHVLAALAPVDFDLLAAHLRDVLLEPGRILHDVGQPVRDIYFPRTGLIGLLCPMPDGHTVETASIGREGMVGIMAALGAPIARNRAVVHLPVHAAQLPAAMLADMVLHNRSIRRMVVSCADALLAQTQQLTACTSVHPVHDRLCRWLLQARDHAVSDTLAVTQEYLSDLLGVQRTTITMMSRMLQAQGIIQVRRGRIHVCNAAALEAKACACYRTLRRLAEDGAAHRHRPAGASTM